MDKLVKLALVLGALLAGVGVFHHYVIFLPGIERAKQEQAAAKESAKQEQVAAEKREAAAKESARQAAYWACKVNARTNYDADSELRENLPDGRGGLVNWRPVRSAGGPPCSATGASWH